MEKIFTLGDNIKSMFENYKAKYPNLKDFEYDAENDILYFNGNPPKELNGLISPGWRTLFICCFSGCNEGNISCGLLEKTHE